MLSGEWATNWDTAKLRSQQERVVKAFVLGQNVFVSLPTGTKRQVATVSSPLCLMLALALAQAYQ